MNSYTQKLLSRADESLRHGRLDEAAASLTKAAELDPWSADVAHRIGKLCLQRGDIPNSVSHFERAVKLNPNIPVFQFDFAYALFVARKFDGALPLIQTHARLNPGDTRSHALAAAVLTECGRLDEAEQSLQKALKIAPDYPDALMNLGIIRAKQSRYAEAIAMFQRVLAGNPDQPRVLGNLATAYEAAGQIDEAIQTYKRALELAPDSTDVLSNLATLQETLGQVDEALRLFERAIAVAPQNAGIHSNYIVALTRSPTRDAEDVRQAHADFDIRFGKSAPLIAYNNTRDPDRRLRIGYVSPDFRNHVVGMNLLPLFRHHARSRFDIVCYFTSPFADSLTGQIRSLASEFHDVSSLSDHSLGELIASHRIDVLVDLSLHTEGNRLLAFARKPAPILVSFAGYPGATGLSAIEYHLTDPHLEPLDQNIDSYVDRAVRLPDTFWCYEPMSEEPVGPLPALQNGYITFGCLSNFAKVNDDVLAAWSKILLAVPESRLMIMCKAGSHRAQVVQKLGIDRERVEFAASQPRSDYLKTYHRIDLGLDTFPYNGHTTSLDSLWMGVPVVTFVGESVVGRAGLSQLSNLGLPELIARTKSEFVDIAVRLASDLPRLAALRSELRPRMEASPLMDAKKFAAGVEKACTQMWQSWCSSRP